MVAVAAPSPAATSALRMVFDRDFATDIGRSFSSCSGASMMASRCSFCLNVTLAMPSIVRSLSPGTFIGPGEGAVPGAGCGNAVERAVWNVTLPSTFCMTWWIWPLSTVTEPKRLR